MIIYMDRKLTANQLAKELVSDKGSLAVGYWGEDETIEHDKLTEKETRDINLAVEKQYTRLLCFFNLCK